MATPPAFPKFSELPLDLYYLLIKSKYDSYLQSDQRIVVNFPTDFALDRLHINTCGVIHTAARDGCSAGALICEEKPDFGPGWTPYPGVEKKSRGVPAMALWSAIPRSEGWQLAKSIVSRHAWSKVSLHFPKCPARAMIPTKEASELIEHMTTVNTSNPDMVYLESIHVFNCRHLAIFIADSFPKMHAAMTSAECWQMTAFRNVKTIHFHSCRLFAPPGLAQMTPHQVFHYLLDMVDLNMPYSENIPWPGMITFGLLLRQRMPKLKHLIIMRTPNPSAQYIDHLGVLNLDKTGVWSLGCLCFRPADIVRARLEYPDIQLR